MYSNTSIKQPLLSKDSPGRPESAARWNHVVSSRSTKANSYYSTQNDVKDLEGHHRWRIK